MDTYRLLIAARGELWTFIVAARDPEEAWRLTLGAIPRRFRGDVALEEMENTGAPAKDPGGRVLGAWRQDLFAREAC
ncbi:MAG: hypothetical protein R3F62_18565 [Planctomycetota bacterium]